VGGKDKDGSSAFDFLGIRQVSKRVCRRGSVSPTEKKFSHHGIGQNISAEWIGVMAHPIRRANFPNRLSCFSKKVIIRWVTRMKKIPGNRCHIFLQDYIIDNKQKKYSKI
jgi:hypothetical protein